MASDSWQRKRPTMSQEQQLPIEQPSGGRMKPMEMGEAVPEMAKPPVNAELRVNVNALGEADKVRQAVLPMVLEQLADSHAWLAQSQANRVWNALALAVLGYHAFGGAFMCLAVAVMALVPMAGMPAGMTIVAIAMYGGVAVLAAIGFGRIIRSRRERIAQAQRRVDLDVQRILIQFPEVEKAWGGELVLRNPRAVQRLLDEFKHRAPGSTGIIHVPGWDVGNAALNSAGLHDAKTCREAAAWESGGNDDWRRQAGRSILERLYLLIIGLVAVCCAVALVGNWYQRRNAVTADRPLVLVDQGGSSEVRIYADDDYFFFDTSLIANVVSQTNPESELRVEVVPKVRGERENRGHHELKLYGLRGSGEFQVRATASSFEGTRASTDFTVKVLSPEDRALSQQTRTAGTTPSVVDLWNTIDSNRPMLLMAYAVIWIAALLIGVLMKRGLRAADGKAPTRELDPYEVACLAEGEKRAAQAAIASLLHAGAVQLEEKNKRYLLIAAGSPPPGATPLELAVHKAAAPPGDTLGRVHSAAVQAAEQVRNRLERAGLLESSGTNARRWLPALPMLGVLVLGSASFLMLQVGQRSSRPLEYFVAATILAAIVLAGLLCQRPFRTRIGDQMLDQTRTRHRILQAVATLPGSPLKPHEVALATALFGTAILNIGPLADLQKAYTAQQASSRGRRLGRMHLRWN